MRSWTGREGPEIEGSTTVEMQELLHDDQSTILGEAWTAVARLEHYRRDGGEAARGRLEALYVELCRALGTLDVATLCGHAEKVARERFASGYELHELQAAFSALEDAIRRRANTRLAPLERAWGFALVGTALSHARAALERTFVALEAPAHPSALDLSALFRGAESLREPCTADEMVWPV